jgi:hypothetical protein
VEWLLKGGKKMVSTIHEHEFKIHDWEGKHGFFKKK